MRKRIVNLCGKSGEETTYYTRAGAELWRTVIEVAQLRIQYWPNNYHKIVSGSTMREIIEECRPTEVAANLPEQINYYVAWVLGWLLALNKDLGLIWKILQSGFVQVLNSSVSA
jgi:hypothetical protein